MDGWMDGSVGNIDLLISETILYEYSQLHIKYDSNARMKS